MICSKCGAQIDDDSKFCTACGAKITKKGKTDKKPQPNLNEGKKQRQSGNTEKILTPTFAVCSMIILFICSFFIGVYCSKDNGEVIKYVTSGFFGGEFSRLPTISYVTCITVFFGNLVVSFLMLLFGGIKYIKGLQKNQTVNITRYALVSFCTFIFAMNVIVSSINFVGSGSSISPNAYRSIEPSFTCSLAITLSSILLVATLIVKLCVYGKEYFSSKNAGQTVIGFITVLFSLILLCVMNETLLYVNSVGSNARYSFSAMAILKNVIGLNKASQGLLASSYFIFFAFIILNGLVTALFVTSFDGLFSNKKHTVIYFILSILILGIGVAYYAVCTNPSFVSDLMYYTGLVGTSYTYSMEIEPIVVFGSLLTIASIVYAVVGRNFEQKSE